MVKHLSKNQIDNSLIHFWGHGDNLLVDPRGASRLPYSKEDLRTLLNLDAIFTERLAVVDGSFFQNEILRQLVMDEGYDCFLSNGVLVPILRKEAGSFVELEYLQRQGNRYAIHDQGTGKAYAQFLDNKVSSLIDMDYEQVDPIMTEAFEDTLLNPNYLGSINLPLYSELTEYIKKEQVKNDSNYLWRSIFLRFADNLKDPKLASRLKLQAAAIWNQVFIDIFDLKPGIPYTYQLEAWRPSSRGASENFVIKDIKELDQESIALIPMIAKLKPKEILELRKDRRAIDYYKFQRMFDAGKNTAEICEDSRDLYLNYLAKELKFIETGTFSKLRSQSKNLRTAKLVVKLGTAYFALLGLVSFTQGSIPDFISVGLGVAWGLSSGYSITSLNSSIGKLKELSDFRLKHISVDRKPCISLVDGKEGLRPPVF